MHDWSAAQMQLPLFSNQSRFYVPVPFLRPQQPTPHSLARWSPQFWQAANIADQGSIFWQLAAFFACPPLSRCHVWMFKWVKHGHNCLARVDWRSFGKLTKLERIDCKLQPNACPVSQVCKLTWLVHGNSCLATCNQMPTLCSNRKTYSTQIAKYICLKLKKM